MAHVGGEGHSEGTGDARSDFSCSSVDQFLRDNGFSISGQDEGSASGLSSLSAHSGDLRDASVQDLTDGLAATATAAAAGSELSPLHASTASLDVARRPPRFVLLDDEELLLESNEDQHDREQEQLGRGSASGDATSERAEAAASWTHAGTSDYASQESLKQSGELQPRAPDDGSFMRDEGEADDEPLDRSMLFGASEFSLSSIAATPAETIGTREEQRGEPRSPDESENSSTLQQMDLGLDQRSVASTPTSPSQSFSSIYQMTPQQKLPTSARAAASLSLPSSSASPGSTDRARDAELNDALGMTHSAPNAAAVSEQGASTSQQDALSPGVLHSRRALFMQDEGTEEGDKSEGAARSIDGQDHWDQYLGDELLPSVPGSEAEEQKEKSAENSHDSVDSVAERGPKGDHPNDHVDEGSWSGLNDLLRKNGLPVVRFQRSSSGNGEQVIPDRESLFAVIHDFVGQLERKNEIIQDLVLASNRNSRVQSKRESELQTSEKKIQATRRALEKAKAEIQRLQAQSKKDSENTELQAKKWKNSYLRLQQQLKVSEHRVKAKEVLVERMQAKLQQQVDKENMNKTRDRSAFRKLQQRDPRRASPHDSQALETIGVYEAQREQMQEELEHLKTQVAALNSELRDKENYIARQGEAMRKAEPPVWHDYTDEDFSEHKSGTQHRGRRGQHYHGSSSIASDDMMLEQLEAARREQELAAAKLRHREAAMIKKVAAIEQELLIARDTIGELKEENTNLTLEAESRPSIRDYRLSQRRIHQLERQVAENKLALEEASDLNELRKYMGTKELVERDRLNHRLHLNRLNTLPRETTLEVVKHVCRVLHLTDITLIAPSLDKLCNVVAAVPRMEKFIRDVCGFVFLNLNDSINAEDNSSANFELEQVLPTLQQWMVERRKLHALESFKASVVTELCKRSVEPSILTDAEESKQAGGDLPNQPTTLSRAVHIVSELVELEKNVLQHREIYNQAATELERRPSVLINQIVRHFSHVFQVKSIEGVLPKINEIYLFVNEMKNFLRVVRELLHLKNGTSIVECLSVIRERLGDDSTTTPAFIQNANGKDQSEQHFVDGDDRENVPQGNIPNFVVDKRRPQGGRSNSQADLVGVQKVREMSILVRELKRELGASTMDEILPRTKRLMELLSLSIHHSDPEDEEAEGD